MIEDLKPYTDYRDSGQGWLGNLPAHWKVLPNRALFDERKERNQSDAAMLSVTITRGIVPQRALLSESSKKDSSNADKSAYKLVVPGDIVYNKMRAWQGALGASHFRGIVSPAYVVLKARAGVRAEYYHHLLRTPAFSKEAERWSYGITSDMWSLRPEHFKLIGSPLPPPDEQAAIVRFLDHANRKIDRFIRAKRKLIALLNEQKHAIVQAAVTRGVGSIDSPRASRVPWLGAIPQHWSTTRLKFCASHIVDCLHATPTYRLDGRFPAIRTADIEPGKVRLEQARCIGKEDYLRWTERLAPDAGDILYSREGERLGIAACVPDGVVLCTSQRMMVFRILPTECSEYIMWQLNCQHVYLQASIDVIGSTSPHVNVQNIKNFRLALPPLEEQRSIVEWIRREIAQVADAIARTEREIVLMQEYRTRLTADIVTGKLDVREAAAKLPDVDEMSVDEAMIDEPDEEMELEATA